LKVQKISLTRKRNWLWKHFGCSQKKKKTWTNWFRQNTKQLLAALQKWNALLDKTKRNQNLIVDETIKRHQYQEGLYHYYTKTTLKQEQKYFE
jgi:hypothetical protein